jgi:hypothetical protein
LPGGGGIGVGSLDSVSSAIRRSSAVSGSSGIVVSCERKSKQLVKSPAIARRQAEMFGSRTPVHSSRNRSTDVWSKTCESIQPPWLHGETTVIGTRGPSPTGRSNTNSSGVPGGAVGGIRWSKKPSCSS